MITLKSDKKGFVGPGMIKGAIVALMFLTVLISMLPRLIHQNAIAVVELSEEYGNTTLYGEGASELGTQVDDWTGYFWVIGPLVLIITVVLGIFLKRRRG